MKIEFTTTMMSGLTARTGDLTMVVSWVTSEGASSKSLRNKLIHDGAIVLVRNVGVSSMS